MMPRHSVSGWVSGCQLKLSGSLLLEEELKVHFLQVSDAHGFHSYWWKAICIFSITLVTNGVNYSLLVQEKLNYFCTSQRIFSEIINIIFYHTSSLVFEFLLTHVRKGVVKVPSKTMCLAKVWLNFMGLTVLFV